MSNSSIERADSREMSLAFMAGFVERGSCFYDCS